jgi:UDP-N-acetylglucosamine--N-acetylmuramyl-(pentapeptide) pyrophosphoryl-undecaprenol N-acetylglucosamine transferase
MRVWFAGGGTGGHLNPGLAVARALVRLEPTVSPFFIGARRGIERELLPKEPYPFELLDLHPLYRSKPWENWKTVRGAVSAWRRLSRIAGAEPPLLVVGTGGYAAGLAQAYAVTHRITLVQQVSDSFPGLTVRAFSRFARELYLGYPEAAGKLSAAPNALVDTGCPIDPPPAVRPDRAAARAAWGFPREGGPVILIFGGSQGARSLNEAVAAWVRAGVPPDTFVIWGTGRAQHADFASLETDRVKVRPYLAPIADAYAATDLALTRAGAMTTSELCAWGIPMVLVPLPTAAADHQTANARALAAAGAAVHLPQRELVAGRLGSAFGDLLARPEALRSLAEHAAARARPHAAEEIARHVLALVRQESAALS